MVRHINRMQMTLLWGLFIFLLSLAGCSSDGAVDLATWIGEYDFDEFVPPDISMEYSVRIYRQSDDFFADIFIDGFQTQARFKANVVGNEKNVELTFFEYLPGNLHQQFETGDVLLSFQKVEKDVFTHWGKSGMPQMKTRKTGKYVL